MGRFERLVSTPALIELFKEKYHIPQEVVVRYCTTKGVEFNRKVGEVVIPMIAFIMIAFIEGGMTIPMVGLHGIIFVPIDSALTSVPPTSLES